MSCLNTHEAIIYENIRTSALVELKNDLETMKEQKFLTRMLGKDRISTTLLDREKALHASFNALQVCGQTMYGLRANMLPSCGQV